MGGGGQGLSAPVSYGVSLADADDGFHVVVTPDRFARFELTGDGKTLFVGEQRLPEDLVADLADELARVRSRGAAGEPAASAPGATTREIATGEDIWVDSTPPDGSHPALADLIEILDEIARSLWPTNRDRSTANVPGARLAAVFGQT